MKTLILSLLLTSFVELQQAPARPPSCNDEFPELKTTLVLSDAATGEFQLKSRLPSGDIGFTNIVFPHKEFKTACDFLRSYQKNGLTPLEFYTVKTPPLSAPGRP